MLLGGLDLASCLAYRGDDFTGGRYDSKVRYGWVTRDNAAGNSLRTHLVFDRCVAQYGRGRNQLALPYVQPNTCTWRRGWNAANVDVVRGFGAVLAGAGGVWRGH